jgi:hypothetical protein
MVLCIIHDQSRRYSTCLFMVKRLIVDGDVFKCFKASQRRRGWPIFALQPGMQRQLMHGGGGGKARRRALWRSASINQLIIMAGWRQRTASRHGPSMTAAAWRGGGVA